MARRPGVTALAPAQQACACACLAQNDVAPTSNATTRTERDARAKPSRNVERWRGTVRHTTRKGGAKLPQPRHEQINVVEEASSFALRRSGGRYGSAVTHDRHPT